MMKCFDCSAIAIHLFYLLHYVASPNNQISLLMFFFLKHTLLPRSKPARSVNKNRNEDTFEFIYESSSHEYQQHSDASLHLLAVSCFNCERQTAIESALKIEPR